MRLRGILVFLLRLRRKNRRSPRRYAIDEEQDHSSKSLARQLQPDAVVMRSWLGLVLNEMVIQDCNRAVGRSSTARTGSETRQGDFRDILVELHRAGARFVVLGGHAVAFHGHPRATKALDILVEAESSNAKRVYVPPS